MPKRRKTLNVEVEPEIIKWALKSSGWTKEEVILKLKISENTFQGWLNKTTKPTLRQLENLSKYLKRPLAVFFLPEPPRDMPLPHDYRMLPEKAGKFDKKTLLAIRKARRLQNVSTELSKNIDSDIKPDIIPASLSDNPSQIGKRYSEIFRINEEVKKGWKTSYDTFNALRDIIENRNIVVFQMPMPVEDARGFTLVDEFPALIVVNSSDRIEARIFTLMHEFGHILLNKSGIDIPENAIIGNNIDEVEKWCNDFASEFLLPQEIIQKEFLKYRKVLLESRILTRLSRKYNVSKAMLLYNMSKFDFITKSQYESVLDRYKAKKAEPKKEKKKGGFGEKADKRCMKERGQKFVSLVYNNVEKGHITHSDALDYLSIKLKNYEKVRVKAKK